MTSINETITDSEADLLNDSRIYTVVATGQIRSGEDRHDVRRRLVSHFSVEPSKLEVLFRGLSTVVKRFNDEKEAASFMEPLNSVGLICIIQEFGERSSAKVNVNPQPEKEPEFDLEAALASLAELNRARNLGLVILALDIFLGVVSICLMGAIFLIGTWFVWEWCDGISVSEIIESKVRDFQKTDWNPKMIAYSILLSASISLVYGGIVSTFVGYVTFDLFSGNINSKAIRWNKPSLFGALLYLFILLGLISEKD